MAKFTIYYRNGKEKVYEVKFDPHPTWKMLEALAEAMLSEEGGVSVWFECSNGLHGMVKGNGR